MSAAAALQLIRWLGPWADGQTPQGARLEELQLEGGLRARLFAPLRGRPRGGWLLAQGLHYLGPADPRFERFGRVLAEAGFLVLAPFLPEQCALRLSPKNADDLAAAFDELERRCRALGVPGKPAVFSISFGSQPAIALAARSSHRERLGALALFGGFADFDETIRFVLTGRAEHRGQQAQGAHDPTNAPVVLLNLLPELDDPVDRPALEAALRALVSETWGRPELKRPGARDAIAARLAAPLGPRERELFLTACLLVPGAEERLADTLRRAAPRLRFADPRPLLPLVRAPIVIVHGRDDDVIPWTEALKLSEAIPAAQKGRLILTGLYGHTGASWPGPTALAREVWALLRIVRSLAAAPAGGM
jgi:pimeloyl-ACP methyl ester carboxylesterase